MDGSDRPPHIYIAPDSKLNKFKGIGHWNAYMRSQAYLSLHPEDRLITAEELAKHDKKEDMWMAFRNASSVEVYDVTPFLEYHPGGSQILAEYAGTDATEPFRCAHAYISLKMISRLKKGRLIEPGRSNQSPNLLSPRMNIPSTPRPPIKMNSSEKPKWDWFTAPERSEVVICINLNQQLSSLKNQQHAMLTSAPEESDPNRALLNIWILLDRYFYSLKLKLLPGLKPRLENPFNYCQNDAFIQEPSAFVHIVVSQESSQQKFSAIGSVLQDQIVEFSRVPDHDDYLNCEVVASRRVANSVYRYLRLRWPTNRTHIPVPFLSHVYVSVTDDKGKVHNRAYTPTCVSMANGLLRRIVRPSDLSEIDILVKVYDNGTVSRLLDCVEENSTLKVSLPRCSLSPSVLLEQLEGGFHRPWENFCFLCAGSGITPFPPLIYHLVNLDRSRILLLWFNRLEQDLVLRRELNEAASYWSHKFTVQYWLAPEMKICPLKGEIIRFGSVEDTKSRQFFDTNLNTPAESTLILICGPPGFNLATKAVTEEWGIASGNVHIL